MLQSCKFKIQQKFELLISRLFEANMTLKVTLMFIVIQISYCNYIFWPDFVIILDLGNLYFKDNGLMALKFTNVWELTTLSKSTQFHLKTTLAAAAGVLKLSLILQK